MEITTALYMELYIYCISAVRSNIKTYVMFVYVYLHLCLRMCICIHGTLDACATVYLVILD